MIRAVLWDVDGTLLDFKFAERTALNAAFLKFGLGRCDDARIARYSALNDRWWRALERQEVTKAQLLTGRFREFFSAEGLAFHGSYEEFNDYYQIMLGETVAFRDDGDRVVAALRGRVDQYAVTNGTLAAQERKLKNSGLDRVLDGAFISELIGAEKPALPFFEAVFAAIPPYRKEEILIVGDSLTSDMRGGNNAGIRCCWYDPEGRKSPGDLRIEFQIRDLNEVTDILARENGWTDLG